MIYDQASSNLNHDDATYHYSQNRQKRGPVIRVREHTRQFCRTKTSGVVVYRCRSCGGVYNLHSGTVFEGRDLRPAQVVLWVRGLPAS